MFFIIKTRTLILYLIATLLFSPVLDKQTKTKTKCLYVFFIIIILNIIVFSDTIPYINNVIKNDVGIQVRFSEIEHYTDYFKENKK